MSESNMSISEMLTYSTVLINCQYADGSVGSGTGFILNLCNKPEEKTCIPVLITNNHVVNNSVRTVFEFCKADENGKPLDIIPIIASPFLQRQVVVQLLHKHRMIH